MLRSGRREKNGNFFQPVLKTAGVSAFPREVSRLAPSRLRRHGHLKPRLEGLSQIASGSIHLPLHARVRASARGLARFVYRAGRVATPDSQNVATNGPVAPCRTITYIDYFGAERISTGPVV